MSVWGMMQVEKKRRKRMMDDKKRNAEWALVLAFTPVFADCEPRRRAYCIAEQKTGFPLARHDFYCSTCGRPAGSVDLFIARPPARRGLQAPEGPWPLIGRISGFPYGDVFDIKPEYARTFREHLARGELFILEKLGPLDIRFYCPDCDALYCAAHWETHYTIDEDGTPRTLMGKCPRGHRRMMESQ